jgi:8-oxo-dGTP pyrophosphatase MutT (NUDIX family)
LRVQLHWFDEVLAKRIADIAAGELEPAAARNAATVMIVRESARDGIEVLMLKRPASMNFAAGAYVFPGGSVDSADIGDTAGAAAKAGWHGPDAAEFGRWLGATPELARALLYAAVRETFEEVGVLLAGPPDGEVVVPDGPSWEADRAALTAGEISLAALLARRGLVLRADLLTPWARWITPLAEPRRFDARFFAAALPAGQRVAAHAAEADKIAWVRPQDALASARKGEMSMLPPTATTLAEFAAASGVADILGRKRTVVPIQPTLVSENGQAWLEVPDDAGYPL